MADRKPALNQSKANSLTHVDRRGQVRMVDVGGKPAVRREAVAEGFYFAARETLDRLLSSDLPKGEALAAARIAGILAAKKCDELVPLCHSLPLESVSVEFQRVDPQRLRIVATAAITARTGVEMEALTAVCVSALTLYDMTKAIDKSMRIEGIKLVRKTRDAVQGR
jgi:cyclic pyranopterin phosphate synthase